MTEHRPLAAVVWCVERTLFLSREHHLDELLGDVRLEAFCMAGFSSAISDAFTRVPQPGLAAQTELSGIPLSSISNWTAGGNFSVVRASNRAVGRQALRGCRDGRNRPGGEALSPRDVVGGLPSGARRSEHLRDHEAVVKAGS